MGFRKPVETALSAAIIGLSALAWAAPAAAQDVTGVWLRDTGASKVRFTRCGDALCGTLSWLKDPSGPAKVGQRIFYDMKPAGPQHSRGRVESDRNRDMVHI